MPEPAAQPGADDEDTDAARRLLDSYGPMLVTTAAASIDHGLDHGAPSPVAAGDYPEALRELAATFVTLEREGRLRGCVGSAEAYRPLIEDVAVNAFAAAFRDTRFPPLTVDERDGLDVSVSVLTPAQPIDFADDDDLLDTAPPRRRWADPRMWPPSSAVSAAGLDDVAGAPHLSLTAQAQGADR